MDSESFVLELETLYSTGSPGGSLADHVGRRVKNIPKEDCFPKAPAAQTSGPHSLNSEWLSSEMCQASCLGMGCEGSSSDSPTKSRSTLAWLFCSCLQVPCCLHSYQQCPGVLPWPSREGKEKGSLHGRRDWL